MGRGGRFFLVGLVIALFGDPVKVLLEAYFEVAVVAFAVLLIGGIYVVDLLGWRSSGWQAPNSHSGSHKPRAMHRVLSTRSWSVAVMSHSREP